MTRLTVRCSTCVTAGLLLVAATAAAAPPAYVREPLPDVLTSSRPAAIADMTGDEQLDLIVAGNRGVYVIPGDGSGQFGDWQRGTPDLLPLSSVTAGDLNGDGLPDLVVRGVLHPNNPTAGNAVRVFLAQTGGTFVQHAYIGRDRADSVSNPGIGDFNGDGFADFALGRIESFARATGSTGSRGAIDVYLGDGTGNFTGPIVTVDGGRFRGVFAAGDLDGDGASDVLTLSDDDDAYFLWLSDGAGGFRPRTSLPAPPASRSVSRQVPPSPSGTVVADLTGLGRRDLLVRYNYRGDSGDPFGEPLQFSAIYYSDGAGGYAAPVILDEPRSHLRSVVSQAVGDVNGDGLADIVLSGPNKFQKAGPVYGIQPATDVYLGTSAGEFEGPLLTGGTGGQFAPNTAQNARLRDLNGDGRLDLIVHESIAGFHIAFGDGAGGFGPRQPIGNFNDYWEGGAASADFNNDGHPDVAVPNSGSYSVSIWLGDGSGGFTGPKTSSCGPKHGPIAIVAADFNADGKMDLATASFGFRGSSSDVVILYGDGTGGFGPPRVLEATGPTALVAGDFDQDGTIDLAAASNLGPTIYIYYDLPGATQRVTLYDTLPVDYSISTLAGLAAADFDENGWTDLVRSSASGYLNMFMNVGNPALQAVNRVTIPVSQYNIAAGEIDGDGHTDIAISTQGSVYAFLGDGNGGFGASTHRFLTTSAVQNVTIADLDGQGQRAIVANMYPDVAVVPIGPGGTLEGALTFDNNSSGFLSRNVPVVDLNGDGLLDIVLERDVLLHSNVCGNGSLDPGEQCDDGNNDACDGCGPRCQTEIGSLCGDGVVSTACEEVCDQGAQNSDTQPDACRTDCQPPRCGDGVIDAGEACDDGNEISCDGCSAACAVDTIPVCGDGFANVACGEQCDDGNAVAADGCSPTCKWETIPGGSGSLTDCFLEWLVLNPSNDPLLDQHGRYRRAQTCRDNDPACDLDGGVPNACTIRFALCTGINDPDVPRCWAQPLQAAKVVRPSEREASISPVKAAIRTTLVGLAEQARGQPAGYCTDWATITTPLGTQLLKVRLISTFGIRDTDTLRVRCVP